MATTKSDLEAQLEKLSGEQSQLIQTHQTLMDAYNTKGSFVDKENASKALEEAQKLRNQVRELQKQLNELDG